MTLNQLVYSIAERFPDKSVPTELLLEMLRFSVVYYRATFLRRDYGDNMRYPKDALQDLGTLELEQVDKAESIVKLGCEIKRTKLLIPSPVRLRNFQEFYYVGGIDKTTPYTSILPEEAIFRAHNKYTGQTPCFYFIRQRIYVLGNSPKYINVQYMLADPREIGCVGMYDSDAEFPLPVDLARDIVMGILTGEYKLMSPPPSNSTEISI